MCRHLPPVIPCLFSAPSRPFTPCCSRCAVAVPSQLSRVVDPAQSERNQRWIAWGMVTAVSIGLLLVIAAMAWG
jgi:hypothetical protein